MSYDDIAKLAVDWALQKAGSAYSQAKRLQEKIFDCSSLVARAYSAQGKRWKYGGAVPTSTNEVYDDDFELLWPATYAQIGKTLGGSSVINLAKRPGDLQFLCTDSKTSRTNRITHVTMVVSTSKIVHARGTSYGVRTDSISLYSGKVCAVVRYNPACTLRIGMKGFRTMRMQQALNAHGADLNGDGDFGPKTQAALRAFQKAQKLPQTGEAGHATLAALGLDGEAREVSTPFIPIAPTKRALRVTGGSVHVRSGPSTDFASIMIANKGDIFEVVDDNGWDKILLDGDVCWVSGKYM